MNYISRHIRLFPVNFQIDQEEINSILKKINSVSFCYYFWHNDYNCLDLLYTSKKPVDFFLNDRVLEKFHYWEINSDEDFSTDTISCRSKFYKSKEDGTFNYASVCYYQTDQIKFIGFNKDFIHKLIKCLEITITSVTSDHYICNKKLFYQASNDRWNSIDNLKANENTNLNGLLFEDGLILNTSEKTNLLRDVFQEIERHKNHNINSIEITIK